jgi:hypothetical protein
MLTGDDASLTTSSKGNDASSTTAETHLRINNGNDAIVARVWVFMIDLSPEDIKNQ